MSEFNMNMGEELLEILCVKLGTEDKVKQWVKDFAEWVDICIHDGDPDYVCVYDSNTDSSETESESDDEVARSIVVEEELTIQTDERGFHSLKDCVVKSKK